MTSGLVRPEDLADLDLSCCAATAQSALPVAPTTDQTIGAELAQRVGASASHGSAERLDETSAAVTASTWIASPRRETLSVVIAAARHRLDPAVDSPYTADELRRLIAADGDDVAETVGLWIVNFNPTPDEIWAALTDRVGSALPRPIFESLRVHAGGLDAKQKATLAAPVLANALSVRPDHSLLEAIRFSDADQAEVARELIELSKSADDDERWRTLLFLWQELKPTREAIRRQPAEQLYIPLVSRGPAGVDAALEYFGLVASLRKGAREEIRIALQQNSDGEQQRKRIEDKLEAEGWVKRTIPIVGRKVDVDDG